MTESHTGQPCIFRLVRTSDASTMTEHLRHGDDRSGFTGNAELKSIGRAEQDVNCGLTCNLCNEICPSPGEGAVAQFYASATRAENPEVLTPLYLKRHIEHVFCGRCELNIDFETAVRDRALHDNLRYVEGA